MLLLLRKKTRGEKRGMRRTYFRTGPLPVTWRGRRREHPNQHCLLLLRVLRNFRLRIHTQGNPEGGSSDRRSHPVAILLLLRKKRGEKTGHAQNLLPVRATSGQGPFRPRDFVTSCQKDPTRADMAQLPVGHAQNILPDNHCRHFRSCDWRHFPSRNFRLLHRIAPPQILPELYPYTTHIVITVVTHFLGQKVELKQYLKFFNFF